MTKLSAGNRYRSGCMGILLNKRNTMYRSGVWTMFAKVLLPTDFSTNSQEVIGYVREIPGVREVILFHVIDATYPSRRGEDYNQKIANANLLMEENTRALEKSQGVPELVVRTFVETITHGDVPHTILKKAEAEKVTLIMMGARGKNTIQAILLGSVSASVVLRSKIPVLIIRIPPGSSTIDEHRHLFSRVLVPVDFSRPSRQAIARVKDIPVTGQVILLHIIDKGESENEIKEAIQAAREKLDEIKKDLAAAGINADVHVHVGYPPDEINATAERDEVSLILMSPRGEGWTRELKALVLGSTTNAVIRRSYRPVLIAAGHTAA